MNINPKYLSIAVYALVVIVAGSLLVMLLFAARDFLSERKYDTLFAVLQPFLYGFVLAYFLNPLMVFFERRVFGRVKKSARFRRMVAVLSTFVTTAIIVTILVVNVAPQVSNSIQQLNEHIADLFSPIEGTVSSGDITVNDPNAIYNELMNRKIGAYITDIAASIQEFVFRFGIQTDIERSARELFLSAIASITVFFNEYYQEIFNAATHFIMSTARQVFNILLAIVAAFYMLLGKERLIYQTKRLLYAFLPLVVADKLTDIARKTHHIFGGFFRGKLLESLIVGIICFIFMLIFGIEYSLLISLIVGITNIIPFFGPFIGAIPSIFFLLLYDPTQALWFAIFILILQQIDGNFIGPKVIGDTMGLSPFWIIFAIMVMTGVMGPLGMFIGVPVFGVIYTLLKEFSAWRLTQKGILPSVLSPIEHKTPPNEQNERESVAKISSLVEGLAKSIQKHVRADQDPKE